VRAVDPKQSTYDIFCGKDCDQQENGSDTISQYDDIEQTPDPSIEESSVERSKFQSKMDPLKGLRTGHGLGP